MFQAKFGGFFIGYRISYMNFLTKWFNKNNNFSEYNILNLRVNVIQVKILKHKKQIQRF